MNLFFGAQTALAEALKQSAEKSVAPVWFHGATDHDIATLNQETDKIPAGTAGRLLRAFSNNLFQEIGNSKILDQTTKRRMCAEFLFDFDTPITQLESSNLIGLSSADLDLVDAVAAATHRIRQQLKTLQATHGDQS